MQIGNRFSYGLSQPIPHSHSHTPTNRFPFQQTSAPSPPPAFSAPSLLREGRRVIPSSPFLSTLLSLLFFPLPSFVALSPGDLIFRRKSKRRMLRDRHRQFPPSSCKKTWKRIHTHEHTGHGDTGDTYLFCIQSDTHSLTCRTRSNRVKYLS